MTMALTEEQKMVRDMVRKLCREKVVARAQEADETKEYPWDLHQLFIDKGLFNVARCDTYSQ
jgi:alkylation response protein AidB-like acyl-CoA dehydrogenase